MGGRSPERTEGGREGTGRRQGRSREGGREVEREGGTEGVWNRGREGGREGVRRFQECTCACRDAGIVRRHGTRCRMMVTTKKDAETST